MKLFTKKEEKLKVGRPKLADTELKKKSLIMSVSCAILIVFLLAGSLVSLNILPKFGKMKGAVTCTADQIPEYLRPGYTDPETGITYEYGFDDPKFYSAVVSSIRNNTSCEVTREQLANITNFVAQNKGITSANGLQYLSNLVSLNLSMNQIDNIDLSNNLALVSLVLVSNNLTEIDLSHNLSLTEIGLQSNKLTEIDLSHNTSLIYLDVTSNKLNNINVSANTTLETLTLWKNNLTEIDISHNLNLIKLNIFENKLTKVDLSHNPLLEEIWLDHNKLTEIDISQNTALKFLKLDNNQLSSIDLSHSLTLQTLGLSYNKLTEIDISQNTALTDLYLTSNQLSSVDLSHNSLLKTILLDYNNLTEIDITHNPKLQLLRLDGNKIDSIDLKNNSRLRSLNIGTKVYGIFVNDEITIENPITTSYDNELQKEAENSAIIELKEDKIRALSIGDTNLNYTYKISSDNNITITLAKIFVYDIISEKYNIDKYAKTINVNNDYIGNLLANINLNNSSLYKSLKDNKLQIRDNSYNLVDEYTLINYRLYNLTSSYYTINEGDKTIDLNGNILSNGYFYYNGYNAYTVDNAFTLQPYGYTKIINNNKLQIKSGEELVGEYTFINYKLYNLTSSFYEIDENNKKIDMKGDILSYARSKIQVSFCNADVNDNKLQIKDSNNNIIDEYTLTNYKLYNLTSSYYTINNENKTIDLTNATYVDLINGRFYYNNSSYYMLNNVFTLQPYDYTKTINGNKLQIKNGDKLIDEYTFINYKLYNLTSSYGYKIDKEDKAIDLNNNILDASNGRFYYNNYNYYTLNNAFTLRPNTYTRVISGNKLQIKSGTEVIDEYTLTNYRLYDLQNSYNYVIDGKNIYARGYPIQTVADRLYVYPNGYQKVVNNDKIEIRDSNNNILDTYTVKDYSTYKLESNYVDIEESLKKINARGMVLSTFASSYGYMANTYLQIYPGNFKKVINGSNLEIRDNNDNLIDTYEVLNYTNYRIADIRFYNQYNYINYKNKTIDAGGALLDNVISNRYLAAEPSGYSIVLNGTNIDLKDPSGNVVDTYEIINYGVYNLTPSSSYFNYTIDKENKKIDVKGDLLYLNCSGCGNIPSRINNYLSLQPSRYTKVLDKDKLHIKNGNEIIDTYTIINYKLYDISVNTSYYSINTTNKTIDARGNIYSTNYIYFNSPNGFSYETTNDKYIIKDKGGNVVDTYTIINAMESNFDSESTLGIGKEFYTKCVQTSKYPGAIGTYPMTKEDVEGITRLYCSGRNISDTTGLDKLTNLESLSLYDNNITSIDVSKNTKLTNLELYENQISSITGLDKLTELTHLDLEYNNLSTIDISKNKLLETIYFSHNKIEGELDLSNYDNLTDIYLYNNKFTSIKLPKNKDITEIDLRNNKLSMIDLSYYDNLEYLYLDNNELESIILPKSENLRSIYASNNKLRTLDVSNISNLEELYLGHNKLSKIEGIENVESLRVLVAHDNNFSSINLSQNTNLMAVLFQKNPLYKNIYMIKGDSLEYNKYISFYNAVNYDLEENEYVKYEDGKLKALKEGSSTIYMYVDNMMTMDDAVFDLMMYCNDLDSDTEEYQNKCANRDDSEGEQAYIIANKIVVYDISSDKYDIDKSKKTIDAKKEDIDVNSINISEGLTIKIDGTNLLVMDGDEVAEVYTILNPKEEVKPSIKVNTPKVVNKNTKNDTEKKEEVKEDKNIYLEGNHVSVFALKEIKGTDRNIVVTSGIFKFTINGKDITDITGDIDLKATIDSLTDSKLNNEIKERIESGLVLDFNSNNNLPGKVKVEINISKEMMETLDNKVNIYTYKDNIFGLIAKDMEIRNNKVSFYVEKLGYYVITSDKVKEGTYNDNDLIRVNKVLNKKEVKKSNINIILIIILLIGVISGISYVLITKKNKNNKSNKKSKKKSKKKKK